MPAGHGPYTRILFEQPGLAQSVLVTRPSGPAYLGLAEGILALLDAGGVPPDRAAWAVDLLREAPAASFPRIAALGMELMSGAGPDRLRWGFRVLINGTLQTPRPTPPTPGA
jgi:hypothetical protein